jgi:murein DD-endopeptidase MepM/ murein hydrolase activator NlpD
MNQKSHHFTWFSQFRRSITSEMMVISHKPGQTSWIPSKNFIFIFQIFILLALSGYIILSVYFFKHTSNQLFFKTQLFHKKLYIDYYTLLADSIEQLFINSLTLSYKLKNPRYPQRFNDLQKLFHTSSILNCPTSGWISSHFGMRTDPVFEGTAFHKGIDIAAPEGTPVYCATDGVVDFCGFKPHLGNVIYIRHHHKNLITIYGHLRSCTITRNALVQKGQLLGLVGTTGKSTGPHLHFEVRNCGIPINPIPKIIPMDTLLD